MMSAALPGRDAALSPDEIRRCLQVVETQMRVAYDRRDEKQTVELWNRHRELSQSLARAEGRR